MTQHRPIPSPRPTRPTRHARHARMAATLCPLALAASLAALPAHAADRYWAFIGGCGSADWISTTAGANAQGRFGCWSATLGGLSGQTFPSAGDDVFVLAPGAAATLLVNVAAPTRPAFTAAARDVTLYGNGSFAAGLNIDRYSMAVRNLLIGEEGLSFIGRVDQSAGAVTVGNNLALRAGAYNLAGGSLNVGQIFVRSQQAAARYTQTGGTLITSAIDVRSEFGRDASFSVLAGSVTSSALTLGGAVGSGSSAASFSGVGTSWSNSGATLVGAAAAGTLDIFNRAQTFTASAVIGNAPGVSGVVNVADLATLWTVDGLLTVGNLGNGVLNVSNGGRVNAGSVVLNGRVGNAVTATLAGARTVLDSGVLAVGRNRDAAIDIADGAAATSLFGVVGENDSVAGTVRVIGASTRWTNATSLVVGQQGNGRVDVIGSALLQSTAASVGARASGVGNVLLTAGAHWQATDDAATLGTLVVGEGGIGNVTLAGGASVATLASTVGDATSSFGFIARGTGSVVLDGAGTLWTTDTLTVGNRGNGSFAAGSGSRLAARSVIVGVSPNGQGLLAASGGGTRVEIAEDLQVGVATAGTITVAGGAAFSAGATRLGDVGNGSGTVRVEGAGSTWTSTQPLVVGRLGQGSFTVAAGATAAVGALVIGQQNNGVRGSGNVSVGDAGSRLQASGALTVGDGGFGTLTIGNQALVVSTGLTQAGVNGRVVLDGGTLRSASVGLGDPGRLDWRSGVLNVTGAAGVALDGQQLPQLLQLLSGRTLVVDHMLTLGADSTLLLSGGQLRADSVVFQRGLLASSGGGANALQMDGISLLDAQGQIGARVVGGSLATRIAASGPLTMGLLTHSDGFAFAGQLDIGGHQVVLLDRDLAGLGVATVLSDGGQLVTVNGALLGADAVFLASGTTSVQGRFVNFGLVQSGALPLSFIDSVNGPGFFRGNVRFLAGYDPGVGSAQIDFDGGSVAFGEHAVLTLEVNGTTPGRGFDRLAHIGALRFDGTLVLDFGAGFSAAPGTVLSLLDFNSFGGTLDAALVVVNGFDRANLDLRRLGIDGTLTVTAVPEPAALALWLAGLGAIALRMRRAARST